MHLSTFEITAQPRLLAGGAPFSFRCIPDLKKSPSLKGLFFVRFSARPEESEDGQSAVSQTYYFD